MILCSLQDFGMAMGPMESLRPCGPAASTAFREVRHEVHVDVFGPARQQKTVCCGWLDQVIYNTYSIVI